MELPPNWEKFLAIEMDIPRFYDSLETFLEDYPVLMPEKEKIFNVFNFMSPGKVKAVLFGEDPYPRVTSACGVAFWDMEIKTWHDKTRGSSLKNILKGLLIHKGLATYNNPIDDCRGIAERKKIKSPPELFKFWLKQGVLLINSAMTFSTAKDKKSHFNFWLDFHKVLIKRLNSRKESPSYILWGGKAQKWKNIILATIDDPGKIICQGHPTFIHQFLKPEQPDFSPFNEITSKTRLKWI